VASALGVSHKTFYRVRNDAAKAAYARIMDEDVTVEMTPTELVDVMAGCCGDVIEAIMRKHMLSALAAGVPISHLASYANAFAKVAPESYPSPFTDD